MPGLDDGSDNIEESLRMVCLSSLKEDEKIIMATSSVPGEGKTTIVTNLALSLADHGKRTLLIDGDIRHPSVLQLLNVDPEAIEYKIVTDLYKVAHLEKYKIYVLIPTVKEDEDESGYFSSANIKKIFFTGKR